MNDELINAAQRYAEELFRGNSDGHDYSHTMRVFRNAMEILEQEPDADEEVVLLGALLHDVDDHKLFDTRDYANARGFLQGQGMDPDRIERICEVIGSVSFSKNRGTVPSTLEGKIVQDADRLDAMGAVGIARTFAYGGGHGRSIESSIEHFYDKLLLLKDGMNTESARKIACRRHELMESFLNEIEDEMGLN